MSTKEDREWDAERDRRWVCPVCGLDDDNCPDDHEETA